MLIYVYVTLEISTLLLVLLAYFPSHKHRFCSCHVATAAATGNDDTTRRDLGTAHVPAGKGQFDKKTSQSHLLHESVRQIDRQIDRLV